MNCSFFDSSWEISCLGGVGGNLGILIYFFSGVIVSFLQTLATFGFSSSGFLDFSCLVILGSPQISSMLK